MTYGIFYDAQAKQRSNRILYSLAFGRDSDIRFDETESPVTISEKDLSEIRR